jgi:CRISPR type I-E-associated protein CasB/Cse2
LLNIDDAGELAMRIPAFVRRCERNGIPVNYYRLLKDIHYWGEFSQLKWADAYWNKRKGGEDEK